MSVSIIKHNEILITKAEWTALNKTHTQEQIIKLISDAMEALPFPFRDLTEENALQDFHNLQAFDSSSIIKRGEVFTKRPYKWGMSDVYIDMSNVGSISSNYFHQEARFQCDSLNSPSPCRVWSTEKFRMNMLKNLWSLETTIVDSNRLRQAMALRNYVASQFKPSAAKAIYTYFKSKKVLDFCGGWGDRLSGFAACDDTVSYTSVDPNHKLHPQYNKQILLYNTDKNFTFYKGCAEDMSYATSFDTVFTSPPYFDIERYTQESNQSWKKYKGDITVQKKTSTTPRIALPQNWLEGFLYKAIANAWEVLEPNGVLAINIADVYGHHAWQTICDPMNDFISTLPDAHYQGGIGYRMAKRPNSLVDEWKIEVDTIKPEISKVYVDPIWVWKKYKG